MADEKKRPVTSFSYPTDRQTTIEASVWKNDLEVDGNSVTTFNITLSRSWRDDEGNWKKNSNLRPHDIPFVLLALQEAWTYVAHQR